VRAAACLTVLVSLWTIMPPAAGSAERRVTFELRTSEIGNLVYQLDCMAERAHCTSSVFVDLWKRLGWTKQDDDALQQWRTLTGRYVQSVNLDGSRQEHLLALPDQARTLDLADKLRLAALGAGDLAQYHNRLELVAQPVDADKLAHIVERFLPRFHTFWLSRHGKLIKQGRDLGALLRRRDLLDLCDRAARLYAADIRSPYTIQVNLIALPRNNTHHSNGNQIERQAVIETEEGERPATRVGVILHEFFHHLYELSTTDARDRLIERFASSADPAALTTYGLLNESVAAALGNGIVERMVQPAGQYEQYLKRERSFYDDDAIDRVAKAILPALEDRLAHGRTLYDEDFVPEYIRLARVGLGKLVNRPALGLRVMVAAILDPSLEPAFRRLQSAVGPGAVSPCMGDDPDCRDLLRAHAQASGVIFLPAKMVSQLGAWEEILGKQNVARISSLAHRGSPVILAAHRSPKSIIYIFIGQSDRDFMGLVDAFVRAQSTFTELR